MMRNLTRILFVIVAIYLVVLLVSNRKEEEVRIVLPERSVESTHINTLGKQCQLTQGEIVNDIFGIGVAGIHREGMAEAIEDLGVKWVRADALWWALENHDGTFDWTGFDAFVEKMHEKDVQLAIMLNHMPNWYEDWDELHDRFKIFVRAIVERYKPGGTLAKDMGWETYGISYWEIFNEPNFAGYGWMDHQTDPLTVVDEYALLLAEANAEIRSEDPNAVILIGGISPGPQDRISFTDYRVYMQELYAYDINNCYDVFAFHPYGRDGRFKGAVSEVRQVLDALGADRKPIWFNEHGTSDDSQRSELLTLLEDDYDAADAYFFFILDDFTRIRNNFGILEYDLTKKKDYERLRALINE